MTIVVAIYWLGALATATIGLLGYFKEKTHVPEELGAILWGAMIWPLFIWQLLRDDRDRNIRLTALQPIALRDPPIDNRCAACNINLRFAWAKDRHEYFKCEDCHVVWIRTVTPEQAASRTAREAISGPCYNDIPRDPQLANWTRSFVDPT